MSLLKSDDNYSELITAFVDGEATHEEIVALEALRRQDRGIEQIIDAEIRIRQAVRKKCRKIQAPEHLKSRCLELLKAEQNENTSNNPAGQDQLHSTKNLPDPSNDDSITKTGLPGGFLKWAVAATILVSSGFWSGQYFAAADENFALQTTYVYDIEDQVQRHFTLASDGVQNEIGNIHNPLEAQQYLNVKMGMNLTVPELKNAAFEGIEMTEFVPGYRTPLLKYSTASLGGSIYIFAFPIDKMEGDVRLVRDIEAIKKCRSASDTHIKDIKGKHIVSWKWGDVWYVGISDYKGEVLASMLPTSN